MLNNQSKTAIHIATTAQRRQADKAGKLYVEHPLRDAGFTETILMARNALTTIRFESDEHYVASVSQNR